MSSAPEQVEILQSSRTGDGSGGKTEVFTPIWTGLATQNFYSKQSEFRLEQSTHAADGPGVQTRILKLWVFELPFPPTIARDYRIQDAAGNKWRVLFVRTYDDTLQIDSEIVY